MTRFPNRRSTWSARSMKLSRKPKNFKASMHNSKMSLRGAQRRSNLVVNAEMAHEIDVERARQAAERAKAAVRQPVGTIDIAEAQAALLRALARLRAVGAARAHKPPTA